MKAKWTFMLYLAGDNDLSAAGEKDLREMSAVGSTADVNVVAEFDRIGNNHHTKRYYVQRGDLQQVDDLGETDSGDPNVLLNFIEWAAANYFAERYALILWNHGSGWEPSAIDQIAQEVRSKDYYKSEGSERSASRLGRAFFRTTMETILSLPTPEVRAICSDDGSGHALDTMELGRVLARAAGQLGQPLDLLGMDACLMSNLEVAYQVRSHAHYVVASEENEPNDGWPYDAVLTKLIEKPDLSTPDLAAHIVSAYIKSYVDRDYTGPVTQSALDLSRARDLVEPLDNLSEALVAWMADDAQAKWMIWSAQRASASFWHNTLWDISHFCRELGRLAVDSTVRQAAESVHATLRSGSGQFVIAESHHGKKVQGCRGITIYMLPPMLEVSRFYHELAYARDHGWPDMLEAYHAV